MELHSGFKLLGNIDFDGYGIIGAGTISGTNIVDSSMTIGSILIAGTGGSISQDNINLYWDTTNKEIVAKIARNNLIHSLIKPSSGKIIYNPLLTYDWAVTTVYGSGSVSQLPMIANCLTGATANSYARQNINSQETYIGFGNAQNYTKIYTDISGNKLLFVGIARTLLATETSLVATPYTQIHAGFIYENGQWYCSSGNGTNQETTAISAINPSSYLRIDGHNTGASNKFYVNDVLVATHTSYVSPSYGYFQWFIANLAVADATALYFYNYGYAGD